MRIALCAVVALLAITPSTCGQTWDGFADFACSNPNGAWSYGWRLLEYGQAFIPMSACISVPSCPLQVWHEPTLSSLSIGRPSGAPSCATWTCPAGYMTMHPGPGTEYAVLRWTAPATAQLSINITFLGIDYAYPTTTSCALMHNGSGLWGVSISSYGIPYPHSEIVNVAAGDTIDPHVSEPSAKGTSPAATADPEPLDEPPLQASSPHGDRPGPVNDAFG